MVAIFKLIGRDILRDGHKINMPRSPVFVHSPCSDFSKDKLYHGVVKVEMLPFYWRLVLCQANYCYFNGAFCTLSPNKYGNTYTLAFVLSNNVFLDLINVLFFSFSGNYHVLQGLGVGYRSKSFVFSLIVSSTLIVLFTAACSINL